MVNVLLGHVGVVPLDARFEMSSLLVERYRVDDRPNDALEPVKHRTCANSVEGVRPMHAMTQAHGIVISVGKPEAHQQSSRRIGAERLNELLAQQPQRRGAQNHHALLVEPNHPFVWAKIQQLG